MTSMFENCINLKNVKMDLINSKATLIDNMFSGCESLTFLELINFDMSSISSIYNFLQGCKKLEYINMNNSASNLNLSISIDPFVDIAENAVICIEQKPFLGMRSLRAITGKPCVPRQSTPKSSGTTPQRITLFYKHFAESGTAISWESTM